MSKRLIRQIAAVLSTVILTTALLTGCGGSDNKVEESLSSSSTNTNANSNEEVLEFQFFRNYAWDVGKYPFDETNKIGKWVMDNKKIKVNFTWPGGGNPNEKLNIMVATDSLPEVIMIARDKTFSDLISKDETKSNIIPLDEFYNKYEGYRTNVAQDVVDFTKINDKIYGMLNWPKKGDWLGYGTGLVLNEEYYKQLGSPKLDTLDDLYNYLKTVKEKDSAIIPLQPGANEVTFGLLWAAFGEKRVPADTFGLTQRPINGELKHIVNDPKFPEFIKYLRKLFKEGLISEEYAIDQDEQVKDKLKRRKVAVFASTDGVQAADTTRGILEAAGKTNPYEAYELPAAPGVEKSTIVTGTSSKLGWNVICLTNNANKTNGKEVPGKAEKIYKYLDWVFSPEGQTVMLCGPEGELWKGVDKNGFPIFLPGKSMKQNDDERMLLPLGKYMYPGNTDFVDAFKMNFNKSLPADQISWQDRQQLKFVNKLDPEPPEFSDIRIIDDNAISQIYVRADDYWRAKMVEFVTKDDDIDTMIKVAKDELYTNYAYGKYEQYATNVWQKAKEKIAKK